MARKPTKKELGDRIAFSPFDDDELEYINRRRQEREEQQRRQEEELQERRRNFSNVEGSSRSTEDRIPTGRTSLDRIGQAARGGASDIAADAMFRDIDAREREKIRLAEEEERLKDSNPVSRFLQKDYLSPVVADISERVSNIPGFQETFRDLSDTAAQDRAAVEQEVSEVMSRGTGLQGLTERAILDVVGSPQSLASIPGGAFAAIPATTTYNDAYRRAREAGMSGEQASSYAEAQAAVEGGISAIPAGRVGKAIFGGKTLTSPIRGRAAEVAVRAGKTMAGESVEEMAQQLGSNAVDKAFAELSDDAATRKFANENLPENATELFNESIRAGLAGFAGGGAISGPMEFLKVSAEYGKVASDAQKQFNLQQQAEAELTKQRNEAVRAAETARRSAAAKAAAEKRKIEQAIKKQQEADAAAASTAIAPTDPSLIPPTPTTEPAVEPAVEEPIVAEAPVTPPRAARQTDEERRAKETERLRKWANEGTTAQAAAKATPAIDVPGSTAKTLMQKLVKDKNSADGQRALRLIANGKVQLMNNIKEVTPNDPRPARGMEYGGQLYIFGDEFKDSKNAAADIAATLFHEVKHGADFAKANPDVPDNIAGFIGMENSRKINAKIEQAAARGNKIAQAAVESAKRDTSRPTAYEEELVPYFITRMKEQRNRASGVANIVSDIRDGVSRGYEKLTGKREEGIGLDEVFGLSEALTDYVANSPRALVPQQAVNVAGRKMFISKGTGESLALSKGRTYLSADGKRKYEIDDSKSMLNLPLDAKPGTELKARDVLKHDELFRELPELADVTVRFEEGGDDYAASYDADENVITMNTKFIGPGANRFNSNAHKYFIHEMQHAAQKASGTTGGANPEMFLSPRGKQLKRQINDHKGAIEGAKAMGFPREELFDLEDELTAMEADYDDEWSSAIETYKRVLGELEAYSTMDRMTLTDSERQEFTSELGRSIEDDFAQDGRIANENNKQLRPQTVPARAAITLEDVGLRGNDTRERITNLGKNLFSAYGTLGKALGQLTEGSIGEASYFADIAQTFQQRIYRGMEQTKAKMVADGLASSMTEADEKIRKHISATLAAMEVTKKGKKGEGLLRRQSMLAALVRQYPDLAPLQEGFQMIDDLTREIVRQQLASKTGPLTDLEIKKIKTMINNQHRYLTRAYAVFQGNDGQKWASKLFREYSVAKARLEKGKNLSDKQREAFEIYTNALNYVIATDVAIFEREDLEQLKLEKLRMVYDTWFSNRQGVEDEVKRNADKKATAEEKRSLVRERLIEQIVQKGTEVNATQITNRAHAIVQGMLGLGTEADPIVTYYRGFKQDRSILMDREKLAQPIRELFGEITDPGMRIMNTIYKQGELVARTKLLLDIKDQFYGQHLVTNEDKGNDSANKFTKQLKGANWGPLADHWVTEDVWNVVRDDRELMLGLENAVGRLAIDASSVAANVGTKAVRGWMRLSGIQKLLAIVWNPAQIIWNFGGSWMMGVANGNFHTPSYVKAGGAASRLFVKELQAAGVGGRIVGNDPDTEDLVRYDIIDSAMVQEIRKLPQQYIRQVLADNGRITNVIKKGANISAAGMRQLFALSDMTVKIANFYQRVDVLTKYYEAEGIEKTPAQIKTEAANTIKDTNITFRRSAGLVKGAERLGLTYVMPYIQGVFRSVMYNYVQGTKDIITAINSDSSEGKFLMYRMGAQRIAGTTAMITVLQAIAQSALTGDEEKDAKIRQLQMEDARYGDSVYIGNDEKGNPLMLRWSRFDPFGPLTDINRIFLSDATKEQKTRDVLEHLRGLIIKPRFGQEAIRSVAEFVSEDRTFEKKDTKLERIFPRLSSDAKQYLKGAPLVDYGDAEQAMTLLDTMMPGFTNVIDPNNSQVASVSPGAVQPSKLDTAMADLLLATGGRLDPIKVGPALGGAASKLRATREEGREQVFERLTVVNPNDRQALVAILDVMEEERKAFIRLRDVYEGMEAMGMSRLQIDKQMKGAGVSEHDRYLLHSGKYDSSLEGWRTKGSSMLSKKSIEEREKNTTERSPDPVKDAQRKESIQQAVDVLRELGYKVKE